jgi:hypothetical protein
MARISNTKWNELAEQEGVLIDTLIHLGDAQPRCKARGASTEAKYLFYDALHEASMGWSCAFSKELREAVYEHRYDVARQMLDTKDGKAKERALIIINVLEYLNKRGDE